MTSKAVSRRKISLREPNPLYDSWKEFGFVSGIMGFNFPEPSQFIRAWEARERLSAVYSWAIPSPEVLDWIASKCPRICEQGAGRGYWANLLAAQGVDVIAYEPTLEDGELVGNGWHSRPEKIGVFFNVRQGDSSKSAEHPDRTLFLCWPPYDTPMALTALDNYQGGEMLFVGEQFGGCCADDAFWNRVESDWEQVETCHMPQWPGLHDFAALYRRK